MSPPGYDAIVLAGGAASRMGGADKAMLRVGGRPLIERVLEAVAGAGSIIVVGPRRGAEGRALVVQEEPPGAGPVAALACGLHRVGAERVAVVAADMPFLKADTVARLHHALGNGDGALLCDEAGRFQPLAAVYNTSALRVALAPVSELSGVSLFGALRGLNLVTVQDEVASIDCDTRQDLQAARLRRQGG